MNNQLLEKFDIEELESRFELQKPWLAGPPIEPDEPFPEDTQTWL